MQDREGRGSGGVTPYIIMAPACGWGFDGIAELMRREDLYWV